MSKKALILGISGQDGAYLARLLLQKGYEVHGTSRDAEQQSFAGLNTLGIRENIVTHSATLNDFRNLLQVVSKVEPDEIYNLAGQSSVGLSFRQPMEAFESIGGGAIQLLEVLRYLDAGIRVYNACSSECFGDIPFGAQCDETTPFRPVSPYAVAKATAFWATVNYREAYNLFACSGILYNHESPLRPERFVTGKIIAGAAQIAAGKKSKLTLGNIDIWRDWGYAEEYAEAMWRMLQQEEPDDYVIATGETHSLKEFLVAVFERLDVDWQEHVVFSDELFRPSDLVYSGADPSKAAEKLQWRAKTRFTDLVNLLVDAHLQYRDNVLKVEAN